MACKTEEKTIKLNGEDRVLSVTQLPAMRGVKLFTRLGRLVGPSLAMLVKGEESKVGEAVRELFAHVNEAEIEHLIGELLFEGGRIEVRAKNEDGSDGEAKMMPIKGVFATEFAGDLGATAQAVAFGLQVNFGNFFSGLGALRARAEALLKKAGPSTTSDTSAGKPSV